MRDTRNIFSLKRRKIRQRKRNKHIETKTGLEIEKDIAREESERIL